MRSLGIILATVSLSSFATCYTGGHHDVYHDHFGQNLHRRNIVYNGQIANTYDFVVVGGGTAGLALASRLSEDSNTTVLVLEAGDTGDAVASSIDTPGNAYYTSLLGSSYDWSFTTVQQPQAGNRALSWPRGKVLGGCSALNGMYNVRPSQVEVDAWANMIDGGDKWNWDSMLAAMKKSETFTPPTDLVKAEANILYDASSHGTSGPLHVSYPGYMLPIVGNWTSTLETPSNLTATAVEYASSSGAARQTVNVNKEVILAGGSIGSPHVLLLSGVGPTDVLQAAGVPVQVALPGVGQHLQDHISTELVFKTTADTAATLHSTSLGSNSTFLSRRIHLQDTDRNRHEHVVGTDRTSRDFAQFDRLLSGRCTERRDPGSVTAPFSQGRLYISSSDPFTAPAIDPAYLSHSADAVMLREGLKLARILGSTAPLSSAIGQEVFPGSTVQSDDDWDNWLAQNIGTEFHPSCSCAMLPEAQGGVVDSNLKVYGLANVRVATRPSSRFNLLHISKRQLAFAIALVF
ncbi:Pyranose dehydrogenase 1 [Grifola frondosa]|uniref:Pyranose dehydrogenase 1 n=1 Tax=Grifola frondosa TaxID=5627 RepID=A0A1C7M9K7_GRIFR|nr:Pyranose dehydrogenase 1 [Grifola frondosa]